MEADSISFDEYRRRTRHKKDEDPEPKPKNEQKIHRELVMQAICVGGHTWVEVLFGTNE